MEKEIVNRVAQSKLVTLDMEDWYPSEERVVLDIEPWLFEGLVLREKDFRDYVANHNWEQYKNCYVAVNCSADAIVPVWAYMLITTQLSPFAKKTVLGNLQDLETQIYTELIHDLDISSYRDKPVIIKGCAQHPIPNNAYVLITQRLQPIAHSIMYGEACSSVPLYKKRK